MSGFVGILNLDGAPVDRTLLQRMTEALAFRGPDGQGVWSEGAVGLGHALLRVTNDTAHESQPAVLDERLWIVADARVDARADLISELNPRLPERHRASLATPDVDLILRAYEVWGEACLDHLLGDFSFVIWDAANRKLFCARDQMGIKPFYYARTANTLIVSNTLQVLRLHPGVSSKLSDLAIGDFLLFGMNLRTDVSTYEDIKKLPPGHCLTAAEARLRMSRCWTFPIEEPFRRLRSADCIREFRTLLAAAVADRLRTDRVSISLSGGLDSPTVAAVAAAQLKGKGFLQATTIVYDKVIPDQERKYAECVGQHLGIRQHFLVGEDYKLFERCESLSLRFPEPENLELAAMIDDQYRLAATAGRIMLTGEGGDLGLTPSLSFYRGRRLFGLLWGTARYFLSHGRHPPVGFHLAWLRWRGLPIAYRPPFPGWLEPNFESRSNLLERWRERWREPPPVHPDRPAAYGDVCQPHWATYFAIYDVWSAHALLEFRHPLIDLRVLRFLLRLPTLPWCADKELLRLAMRGDLPEDVLRRPKSPLAGDPFPGLLQRENSSRLTRFAPVPELSNFIVPDRLPGLSGDNLPPEPALHLRPLSLNLWLQSR